MLKIPCVASLELSCVTLPWERVLEVMLRTPWRPLISKKACVLHLLLSAFTRPTLQAPLKKWVLVTKQHHNYSQLPAGRAQASAYLRSLAAQWPYHNCLLATSLTQVARRSRPLRSERAPQPTHSGAAPEESHCRTSVGSDSSRARKVLLPGVQRLLALRRPALRQHQRALRERDSPRRRRRPRSARSLWQHAGLAQTAPRLHQLPDTSRKWLLTVGTAGGGRGGVLVYTAAPPLHPADFHEARYLRVQVSDPQPRSAHVDADPCNRPAPLCASAVAGGAHGPGSAGVARRGPDHRRAARAPHLLAALCDGRLRFHGGALQARRREGWGRMQLSPLPPLPRAVGLHSQQSRASSHSSTSSACLWVPRGLGGGGLLYRSPRSRHCRSRAQSCTCDRTTGAPSCSRVCSWHPRRVG